MKKIFFAYIKQEFALVAFQCDLPMNRHTRRKRGSRGSWTQWRAVVIKIFFTYIKQEFALVSRIVHVHVLGSGLCPFVFS